MATPCTACPLRRLDCFSPMEPGEIDFMQTFKSGELTVDPGSQILMEGSNSPQLFTVLEGMGLRYKTLANGRRQVVNFVWPGDFLGLQAGVMGEMGHSVEATTRMRLCVFDRGSIWRLFQNHPQRAYDLTWLAAVEEHFLGEALSSLGQRSAIERMAWAFVRLHARAEALALARPDGSFPLPYRQQDLADALGLSLVHTNKTLARLRDRQLVSWNEGAVTIFDLEALADLGQAELGPPRLRPLI